MSMIRTKKTSIPVSRTKTVVQDAGNPDGVDFTIMRQRMEQELENRRQAWEQEVLKMSADFFQMSPEELVRQPDNQKEVSVDVIPRESIPERFPIRPPGAEIIDIQNSDTVYTQLPDGRRVYRLRFDVRGFEPGDIHVRMEDDKLAVSACHDDDMGLGSKSTRKFNRKMDLPDDVDPDTIQAHLCTDGILMVEADLQHSGEVTGQAAICAPPDMQQAIEAPVEQVSQQQAIEPADQAEVPSFVEAVSSSAQEAVSSSAQEAVLPDAQQSVASPNVPEAQVQSPAVTSPVNMVQDIPPVDTAPTVRTLTSQVHPDIPPPPFMSAHTHPHIPPPPFMNFQTTRNTVRNSPVTWSIGHTHEMYPLQAQLDGARSAFTAINRSVPRSFFSSRFLNPLVVITDGQRKLKLNVPIGSEYSVSDIVVKYTKDKIGVFATQEITEPRLSKREFSREFELPETIEPSTMVCMYLPTEGQVVIGASILGNSDHQAIVDSIKSDLPADAQQCRIEM